MGIFDGFGKKITEAGQGAIAKAKDFADIAKLNASISEAERGIEQAYSEIGKLYYEVHKDDYEECFEVQISTIKDLSKKIAAFQRQIIDVKGVVTCANCGAEVPKDASFCAACGSPIVIETEPEEIDLTDKVICPSCGEVLDQGAAFCAKCGTKLEKKEQQEADDKSVPDETV